MNIALLGAFLLLPAAILFLVHTQQLANRIGAILLCYGLGFIVGHSGLLPDSFEPVQNQITEISIALALPLLLFALDIRTWFRMAGKAMLSLFLAVIAVVATTTGLLLSGLFQVGDNAEQLAGLAIGVYTGGTVNLAAIKVGLGILNERYLLFHTFDTLLGAIYIFFMLAVGARVFSLLLHRAPAASAEGSSEQQELINEDFRQFLKRATWIEAARALGMSLLVVGVSVGLAELLPFGNKTAVTILLLTSLGILGSLVPYISALKVSFKSGMYLIYIFSFTVATMADFGQLSMSDGGMFFYIVAVIVLSLIIHALLCRWFKVDLGTFMVTSVAFICSPPFVPMFARSLGNPALLITGFSAGVFGYALGNYLGIGIALLLAPYL